MYGQTLAVVRLRSTSATINYPNRLVSWLPLCQRSNIIILWTSLIFGVVNTGSGLEIDMNQRCEIGFFIWHTDKFYFMVSSLRRCKSNPENKLADIWQWTGFSASRWNWPFRGCPAIIERPFYFSNQFFRYHQNIMCPILTEHCPQIMPAKLQLRGENSCFIHLF